MRPCVPPSSSKTIVFPLNEHQNTFYTGFYEPDMTNNRVSLKEINQFISRINIRYAKYNKKMHWRLQTSSFLMALLALAIVLDISILLIPFKGNFLGLFTKSESMMLPWMFLIVVDISCYLCNCKLHIDVLAKLKDKCQDLVDHQNEILRHRNLKWHLPAEFPTWIELTQDMEKPNQNLRIATQEPLPQTTEDKIIFPLQYLQSDLKLNKVFRFSQDAFPLRMANGQISCQEVHKFISEINACLRISFKRLSRTSFNVFFTLYFELFGLLYISNHLPYLLTTLQAIIIAVVSVVLSFIVSSHLEKREAIEGNNLFKAKCQEIVERYNETLQNRGLRWYLPDLFLLWIELCKVDQNQNQEPRMNCEADIEMGNHNHNRRAQNNRYAPLPEDDGN